MNDPSRELTREVALCDARGDLAPDAVGWSRTPVHDCAIPASRWGRRKRWQHWTVATGRHALMVTVADLDYLAVASVALVDYATGEEVRRDAVVPLGGLELPRSARAGSGDVVLDRGGLAVALREEPAGTRITARFRAGRGRAFDADVLVERPGGHETLSVVVPWDRARFQYNSKHVALPAQGEARVGGRAYRFDADEEGGAFACLDFGRGVWPYRTAWNWACAAARVGRRVVGVNLGARWTDGTGATENGLVVDGRVHKVHEDAAFGYDRRAFARPWRIASRAGARVDLVFEPVVPKRARVELLAARAELHLFLGRFRGAVVTDGGERLELDGAWGWAEEFLARW